MKTKENIFLSIMTSLQKEGALAEIILIGSWCQYFYRIYFNNTPEISAIRTVDIDFLIPRPHNSKKDINVPDILNAYKFVSETNYISGYNKFVNPELEIEFLTPELGKGSDKPYLVKNLHVTA
ncbi:MAG: hypothetical protein A2539_07795 [Elusimicrobia bacterium RIFOXYD2_FULL_34_15]|nr:MAG: hypothetical protein A2539_07795 [Elusimicrobia bacterium RIFOXYD2_FULL_34_15]